MSTIMISRFGARNKLMSTRAIGSLSSKYQYSLTTVFAGIWTLGPREQGAYLFNASRCTFLFTLRNPAEYFVAYFSMPQKNR